jgi:hypothetical protein
MNGSMVRIAVISASVLLFCMAGGKSIYRSDTGGFESAAASNNENSLGYQKSDSSEPVFRTEHVWDAKVAIGDLISVGPSKRGERRIIPITGGTFRGPKIQGDVLPMGEDWQLVRHDGDTELYARYLLKTNDGYLIQVINRALIHIPSGAEKGNPYVRSVLDIEAPTKSPYDYLNHAIFLGTLTMPELKQGEKPYVIIGVHRVL